jgi:L-ascorbate metabolism protein UlaG (beta-lactamase superfamily)
LKVRVLHGPLSNASITYVGHATVLVELDGTRLLTDPVLRGRIAHLRRRGAAPAPEVARGIDAVLVSHLHYDHLDFPSLRRVGRDTRLLVPRGAARLVRRAGFPNTTELSPGETAQVGAVEIRATDASHDDRRRPLGTRAAAIGFELRGTLRIYFAGDTDLFDEMAELAGVDIALLPIAGYSPKLGPGHLDTERAAQAAALLQPKVVVPIHWGTLIPVGLRGSRARAHLTEPPLEFAAEAARIAPQLTVTVLTPGETLSL